MLSSRVSALSKAGFQVAHLDVNAYYGGNEASLTIDELLQWADEHTGPTSSAFLAAQRARFTSISRSSSIPPQSRQYSLSLAPSIIPSTGPLIDALIASGVSRYGGFKLLETVAIYDCPGQVKSVPGSKEAIFKNKSISLLDKRRLMRFLMFAAAEFEDKPEIAGYEDTPFVAFIREKFTLSEDFASIIAYALAFCISASGEYMQFSMQTTVVIIIRDTAKPPPTCLAAVLTTANILSPCAFVVMPKCLRLCYRSNSARSTAHSTLPTIWRQVRSFTFSRRPLRRTRRNCSRILSHVGRQRRHIRSWPANTLHRPFKSGWYKSCGKEVYRRARGIP